MSEWVAFLNTADPTGADRHDLYDPSEAASAWPKYGQIDKSSRAQDGHHYSVSYPEWADKPYGFANFLRAARFVNSLYNGRLLSKRVTTSRGFDVVAYRVRLSRRSSRGMYDLPGGARKGATRTSIVASSSPARMNGPRRPTTTRAAAARSLTGSTRPTKASSEMGPRRPRHRARSIRRPAMSPMLRPSRSRPSTGPASGPDLVSGRGATGERLLERQPLRARPDVPTPRRSRAASGRLGRRHAFTVGHRRPGRQRRRMDRHDYATSCRIREGARLATPTRRCAERTRLPAVALRGRPPARGQQSLQAHLPVARLQGCGDWQSQGPPTRSRNTMSRLTLATIAAVALAVPAAASAAPPTQPGRTAGQAVGALVKLHKPAGCVADRSSAGNGCTAVRALRGPGPFLGSNAVAISPDGRYAYVASAKSNAITIFKRNAVRGTLSSAQVVRVHRRQRGPRLRHGGRACPPELGRRQRRRCQRLCDIAW